jgi:hypothetical protein
MNISKLGKELDEASATRASEELDRMITIHQGKFEKKKEKIKRYLYEVATVTGKELSYKESSNYAISAGIIFANSYQVQSPTDTTLNLSDVYDLVEEQNAVAALVNLKKELE